LNHCRRGNPGLAVKAKTFLAAGRSIGVEIVIVLRLDQR
jgi:hypothetical protein